jgi:hypothetical protein
MILKITSILSEDMVRVPMTFRRIKILILILLAVISLPANSHSFGAAKRNVPRGKTHVKGGQGRSTRLEKRAESDYRHYSHDAHLMQYRQMLKSQQAGLQQAGHETNNRNQ